MVERDALVTLGLLTRLHLIYDPQIVVPGASQSITHFRGYNVHSCIIDNLDGEVVALEWNTIHSTNDPLQHGEQRALRVAIPRLQEKRPRRSDQLAEDYAGRTLFDGSQKDNFLTSGCTLYNTLDPCIMCTSTLLLTHMKRVAYLIEDAKFAGAWDQLKKQYFSADSLLHGPVNLDGPGSKIVTAAASILEAMNKKTQSLRAEGVWDIHLFDHFRDEAAEAAGALQAATEGDLVTSGADRDRNARTLKDLKRLCNFPV